MIEIPSVFIENIVQQYIGYPKRQNNRIVGGCPYCREDSSWGRKSRFFWYLDSNTGYCFNCQINRSAYMFIKDQTGWEFSEIRKKIKEETGDDLVFGDLVYDSKFIDNMVEKEPLIPDLPMNAIDLTDINCMEAFEDDFFVNLALREIKKRRLDTAINRPPSYYLSHDDFVHRNRLIIPFYDFNKNVCFYQSRALTKKQEKFGKYLSKMDGDKTISGIERLNPELPFLFIFEGPLDSFFVVNGLAVTGLTLTNSQKNILEALKPFYQVIWCLDNHFENQDTKNQYKKLIDSGERVFLWERNFPYKDLNEYAVKENLDAINPEWIIDRSFRGSKAKKEFIRLTC